MNWFRRDAASGELLWPGFGENLRAVLWALERAEGHAGAAETPMGWIPTPKAFLRGRFQDRARPPGKT